MADWKWSIQPTHAGLIRTIEQLNCGLMVEDADGVVLYANQRVLEWSGYEVGELEGEQVSKLVPLELHDRLTHERLRALEGDQRTRLTVFQRRDGRTFPVAVAPSTLKRADTGQIGLVTLLIDLGEVQTARPMGADEGSLSAELALVAAKLQTLSFTAAVSTDSALKIDHPDLRDLSPREKENLEHLMNGLRVPAIAKILHISQHTVRNHLKAIYRKLGVSSQSDLIEFIRSLGRKD